MGGAGTHVSTPTNSQVTRSRVIPHLYCIQNETYQALVSEVAPPEAVLSNSGWGGREVEEGRVPLDDTAFSSMSASAVWSWAYAMEAAVSPKLHMMVTLALDPRRI